MAVVTSRGGSRRFPAHDRAYLGSYGGPLRPLIGCDVLEVAPLANGDVVEVEWADRARTTATFWVDVAIPRDGEVLATVVSGLWAGSPAVVRTRCGEGWAYYIATRLDAEGLRRVYDMIPAPRGGPASTLADLADGVERVTRSTPGRDYAFLVNHSDGDRKVQLGAPGFDLLAGRPVDGTLELDPAGRGDRATRYRAPGRAAASVRWPAPAAAQDGTHEMMLACGCGA